MKTGGLKGYMETASDVTKIKMLEDQVKELEKQIRGLKTELNFLTGANMANEMVAKKAIELLPLEKREELDKHILIQALKVVITGEIPE